MRYAAEASSKAHALAMAASKEGIHEFRFRRSSRVSLFTVEQGWAYPSIVGW